MKKIDRSYEEDVQAFSRLVSRYRDMAFGYALTLVDREQTAEDAVQEAMVIAYTNRDRLREPRAFGAWLRGIVRHQCYRAIRSEPVTESWDTAGSDLPDPSTFAVQDSIWDQVREAIQALEPEQREMVYLHYECGLSQNEIATKLSLTAGTVNMRLHAVRARLKRRLKPMTDNTSQTTNPGRIQEINGPLVTVQFAPNATPPILSCLLGNVGDRLCVVRHLSAGRVLATTVRPGSFWTLGQEVQDAGVPFAEPLDQAVIVEVIAQLQHSKSDQALASGIKAIDVFAPLSQSGTTGIFTEWGLGVLVLLPELIHHLDKENNRQTFLVFLPPMRDAQHWKELNAEITLGTMNISITYLPVADPIKKDFVDSVSSLDAQILLSRHMAEQALWPCIDPLACRSKRLDLMPDRGLAAQIKDLMRSYYALQFSIDDARRHTLSQSELDQVQRARKALRYLSQPFFVAEPYTKRPGAFVDPEEAKKCFTDILEGRHDTTHKDAFYMTGAKPKE